MRAHQRRTPERYIHLPQAEGLTKHGLIDLPIKAGGIQTPRLLLPNSASEGRINGLADRLIDSRFAPPFRVEGKDKIVWQPPGDRGCCRGRHAIGLQPLCEGLLDGSEQRQVPGAVEKRAVDRDLFLFQGFIELPGKIREILLRLCDLGQRLPDQLRHGRD